MHCREGYLAATRGSLPGRAQQFDSYREGGTGQRGLRFLAPGQGKVAGCAAPSEPPAWQCGGEDPFSPQDEVLLIQEAKRECHGSWYLPAGRMEPGETIVEALQREVKEEAGLHCEPLTLLSVEERGPSWIRFVFLARPTGMAHLVAAWAGGS